MHRSSWAQERSSAAQPRPSTHKRACLLRAHPSASTSFVYCRILKESFALILKVSLHWMEILKGQETSLFLKIPQHKLTGWSMACNLTNKWADKHERLIALLLAMSCALPTSLPTSLLVLTELLGRLHSEASQRTHPAKINRYTHIFAWVVFG